MRLINISITTFLLLSLFSLISLCPSDSKKHFFRSLATTTSAWNSTLETSQKEEYKTMIDLKTSFTGSLSFLPTSFTPEKEEYWKNLNLIIGVFAIIAAFPFGFVVFYLIVRFVCKKCRGPEKVSQVTRVYRNISWILFGISGVTLIVILSIVLGYSNKANKAMIASLNSSMEKIKSTEDMITPLTSAIDTIKNDKTTSIKIDEELYTQFKSGIDNYVLVANNRTNEAISSENMRNTVTILIFTAYLIIIVLTFLSFFMKWQSVLTLIAILVLFSISFMLVFEGYITKFYFYYSDMCSKVYSAMYENEFPVANQGLGYYINCLERQTKSQLYTINYQMEQVSQSTTDQTVRGQIKTVQEKNLKPLLECENVYNVIPAIEGNFCYKGMNWINSIISLLTWVLLILLIFAISINRLEILVWKKKTEIDSMIENLEAIY